MMSSTDTAGSSGPGPPVVTVVGSSGVGKTTVMEGLIGELSCRGIRVGTVKHHHAPGLEMDRPGKDSWRHKRAGAAVSLVASPGQLGLVKDLDRDLSLRELLVFFTDVDLVLAEGYKRETMPKLIVFRPEVEQEPVCLEDEGALAVITDAAPPSPLPCFSPREIEPLADFLISAFRLESHRRY